MTDLRPKRPPGRVRRFLSLDPRSQGNAGSAIVAITIGVAYSKLGLDRREIPLPDGLALVSRVVPLWVFAAAWLAVGLCLLWVAMIGRRHRAVGLSAIAITLGTYWWLSYAIAWCASGFTSTDFISAGIFFGFTMKASALGRLAPARPRER